MISHIHMFLSVVLALATAQDTNSPANSIRSIPPIDAGLKTGPEMAKGEVEGAEKQRQLTELRHAIARIDTALASAASDKTLTLSLEAEKQELLTRRTALLKTAPDDPPEEAWALLRARLGEIRAIGQSTAPINMSDAQRLVDSLYTNIDPKLNSNLQHSTLTNIERCGSAKTTPVAVRKYLRDSVLDYHNAAAGQCDSSNQGALCSPLSMLALARAIAGTSTPNDDEAVEVFMQLHSAATEKCDELQWGREGAILKEIFKKTSEGYLVDGIDTQELEVVAVESLEPEDIARLLRRIRRLLRAPPQRISSQTLAAIDQNLVRLAGLDLNQKNWDAWGDAVVAMEPSRATPSLRAIVVQSTARPASAKSNRLKRAIKMYSSFEEKAPPH
ncbi:MAG: hypothetical protein HZA51_13100 [Planctomycetes bacterium]|nr:hypothetical protein [Planctomycetota bacterium]